MTGRAHSAARQRLRRMYEKLLAAYGPQSWWPGNSQFEVIVGAYLTQNTAWRSVERSLENLHSAGVFTPDGLRRLPLERLRELIRPSGFATRKAPALKAFIALLDAEYSGSLETMGNADAADLRSRLLALPGVGPETADAILLYGFQKSVPVADEYLRRIVERHQMTRVPPRRNRRGYDQLIQLTMQSFSDLVELDRTTAFNEFHALTVAVGKAHCGRTARCENCPLEFDLRGTPPGKRTP